MKTLYEKIWQRHVVESYEDGSVLLYIDRHLLHEVTTPQAFSGLKERKRPVWRTSANLAVADHNVPTINRAMGIDDPVSRKQVETLKENCAEFGIDLFEMTDIRQGIVHIIGPEQGFTLPGTTLVCGDSHTSTHGAFAALAFGIGTSEVEEVLATQCLIARPVKTMAIRFSGKLPEGLSAKDMVLAAIGLIGTAGGTGYAIEFLGDPVTALSMEGRMTLCNMAIEAGARFGLVAVDEVTLQYLEGRPLAPKGDLWQKAKTYWHTLVSDEGAPFDRVIEIHIDHLQPQVTWGTSPEMVASVHEHVPSPSDYTDPVKQKAVARALDYMGLKPGQKIEDIFVDQIFIGSCTNARLEDLRLAAEVVRGKKIANTIKRALVVPGSGLVKQAAEQEGLDRIFKEAGFEWREPGCSMCLAMNADKLMPGERCASTSNRNFEGRQGQGGRTHLVSPKMAAAAAIAGHFIDFREL
jgi:3-isopropylmalate/(R)-2-methylmalate dehydratase large subunit